MNNNLFYKKRNINPMIGGCKFSNIIYKKVIDICGHPKSIIELGCGNGGNLEKFSDSVIKIGIDPHIKNINNAKMKNIKNCEFIYGSHIDLKKFGYNSFDVGITLSVLDHIEDYKNALSDMMNITKTLILIEPIKSKTDRLAHKEETFRWSNTWYHDYQSFLETNNIKYLLTPCELYKTNSGPLYHLFHIDCGDFSLKG